jgi:hypothetical protein
MPGHPLPDLRITQVFALICSAEIRFGNVYPESQALNSCSSILVYRGFRCIQVLNSFRVDLNRLHYCFLCSWTKIILFSSQLKLLKSTAELLPMLSFSPFACMPIDAASSVDDHQFCQVRAMPSHMIQEQHSLPTCMTTRSLCLCVKP